MRCGVVGAAGLVLAICPLLGAVAAEPGAAEPADGVAGAVAYTIVDGVAITESLTGASGDPDLGARIYFSAAEGGCAGCHGTPGAGGSTAPDLADAGARLGAGGVRLWIVAPQAMDPTLASHSFFAAGQRTGAADPRHGGPHLTAAEVEALVAYLGALSAPEPDEPDGAGASPR